MSELKIAVCDDEEFYRSEIDKLVSVFGNEYNIDVETVLYDDMTRLVDDMLHHNIVYDILLLDIDMPQCSGIEAARHIREKYSDVVICFITSHERYALSAFEVDAIGYVVKPVKYYDIKKQLQKARILVEYRKNADEADKKFLTVLVARKTEIIDLDKVVYIEKRRNQCVFHLYDGEILCYDTLKNVYNKLNKDKFMFSHQGYIANFDHIKEVRKNVICFGNNMEIPVSRKYHNMIETKHLDKIYRLRKRM